MNSRTENKKPGIIDPPLNVQDTFTLQTWMQQVTEALRQGMGQVGSVGQSFVTFDDLVQGGLLSEINSVQSYSHAYTDGSVAGGAYQGSGTGSETYDLTPPGMVSHVVVTGLVGSVQIEWTPPNLNYPHYFEVWRSSTGNAADRLMVGTTRALRYTDVNVEDEVTYNYWVRVVKSVGASVIYGSYDSDTGTAAMPRSTATNILDIVGEDMYIKTPGGDINPFTYLNLGTAEAPVWVVALRADVAMAIKGSLAISQLQSGELSPNAAFTLGNQSVVMDTRSDGSGQIIVSGDGGTQSNDYLVLNQGAIASYVWNGSEHVPYKEVRRIERGVASAGQQVTIPAWFKAQPTVYLSPFIIPTYNPDYPTQGQQWRLSHGNVEPNPNQAGGWMFTPVAQLELTDGNSTQVYPDKTYNGSNDSYEIILTNHTSLKSARYNIRLFSIRSTGSSGSYYHRKVEVTVWYRQTGTTTWLSGVSQNVNINRLSTGSLALDLTMPATANYDLKIEFRASDRGGTFTDNLQYEYRTLYSNPADVSTTNVATVDVNTPGLSGWSLTSATLAFDWRFYSTLPFGASAQLYLPADASGGTEKINLGTSDYEEWGDKGRSKSGSRSFAINASNTLTFDVNAYDATADIKNITGTFHYRRLVPVSATATNAFYLDSVEYDQGAQRINPTSETILINWLAVGE